MSTNSHEFQNLFLGLLLLGVFTLFMFLDGIFLSKLAGPFSLIYIFLGLLLLILTPLDFWLSRFSIPFYSLLVFSAFFVGQGKYGQDHLVRRIDSGPTLADLRKKKIGTQSLPETFAAWLKCRSDFADYRARNKPYPVFIVAAEGGGTYAAIHANSVLSKLTDMALKFPEHTFMISAVSGGAIGAAAYSAAISQTRPPARPSGCEAALKPASDSDNQYLDRDEAIFAADAFVRDDFLSPVIGGAVFPNFVQRFLPVADGTLDRARWLEYSAEDTWSAILGFMEDRNIKRNAFKEDYFTFWDPASRHPGLVINMVIADDGYPAFLAPFGGWVEGPKRVPDVYVSQLLTSPVRTYLEHSGNKRGVSLSTAVGMAARFPYVFGPAVIDKAAKDVPKYGKPMPVVASAPAEAAGGKDDAAKVVAPQLAHFVDGGYYDVTGINSAALIYAYLKTQQKEIAVKLGEPADAKLFDVHLIFIGAFSKNPPANDSAVFRGVLFPIQTLNNTRYARANNVHDTSDMFGYSKVLFMLAPDDYPFPLGLYVEPKTAEKIIKRTGETKFCSLAQYQVLYGLMQESKLKSKDPEFNIAAYNSCSLGRVRELLE